MKEKNTNWKVSIVSTANRSKLSDKQLDTIFNCFKNEDYQCFRNETIEGNKKYDKFPVAKWQLQKAIELEELWHNSIDYTINENIVKVCINLEVEFPKSFDREDVIIWVEGLSRLNKVYLMVQMEDIVNQSKNGVTNPFVDRNENDFLHELEEDQFFHAEKI